MQTKISRAFISVFFVLGSLLSAGFAAATGVPVVHTLPTPAWVKTCKEYNRKPSQRSIQNGYFFALTDRQIDVERHADYHHIIREIVADAGIQNGSSISISFDPSYQRLDFHTITIWRNNKPQNRLDASAFKVLADEEDFSRFIYQGSYTADYILNDVRRGDRIEYSYTLTGSNPVFNGKYCQFINFQWGQPVAHQYVSLTASTKRKLNFKVFNKLSDPTVTTENGTTRYVWENFQVQPPPDVDHVPSWYSNTAYTQVSEFNNWAEMINWGLKVNPIATDIKGPLAVEIARLKKEAGGDEEKYFRSAVNLVQNEIRYMGIEIGEYSHRANRPERVFAQRYGDCKDKSLLLASMLRANGIPADMVLINTDQKAKVADQLPATNDFDHAVVVATVKGKDIWVDATIASQGGSGTNLYFPDYGKGLQLKAGNIDLVDIPQCEKGKVSTVEQFTIPASQGKVLLDVKTTYNLNEADDMRDKLASEGIGPTEKSYLKYYTKTYPKIVERDSLTVNDDEQKNVISTVEHYTITDFFKRDTVTGKYLADFYANTINNELPNITNDNKTPVALSYPLNIDYTLRLIMTTGWNFNERSKEIKNDAYYFSNALTVNGDTLNLHYQLSYLNSYVTIDKREQFRQDVSEISNNQLSLNFSYRPANVQSNYRLNTGMLIFSIIITLLLAILGIWIYRRETPGIVFEYGASFVPIGGWLILIIIGLGVTPFSVLSFFVNDHVFSLESWNSYARKTSDFAWKVTLLFETAANTLLVCYAIFNLILLLNKRDIFPKAMIGFLIFAVLYFMVYNMITTIVFEKNEGFSNLIFSAIVSAIGVPYLLKSTRVNTTFIVPYPHDNFSYEGRDTKGRYF